MFAAGVFWRQRDFVFDSAGRFGRANACLKRMFRQFGLRSGERVDGNRVQVVIDVGGISRGRGMERFASGYISLGVSKACLKTGCIRQHRIRRFGLAGLARPRRSGAGLFPVLATLLQIIQFRLYFSNFLFQLLD